MVREDTRVLYLFEVFGGHYLMKLLHGPHTLGKWNTML